jgi:T5orf172 domain
MLPKNTAAEATGNRSVVYFIQSEETRLIKIGTSKDPAKRLLGLQTGNGGRLTLLGAVTNQNESGLHSRFSKCRAHGEWFRPEDELLGFLRQRGFNPLSWESKRVTEARGVIPRNLTPRRQYPTVRTDVRCELRSLTVQGVHKTYNITPQRQYALIKQGVIKTYKLGRTRYIIVDSIENAIAGSQN